MAKRNYDCRGWATKFGVLCGDGRTIMPGAFREQDGQEVPLVWNHQHNDAKNVLGHALLKAEPEGMRAYVTFNDTDQGRNAKALVKNRDITSFSIYADRLQYAGDKSRGNVAHGIIRELSLVLAGANPEAHIDEVLAHGEASVDEGVIYNNAGDMEYDSGEFDDTLEHSDDKKEEPEMAEETKKTENEETVKDVYNSMSDKQKQVVDYMVSMALNEGKKTEDTEEETEVKHNIFDKETERTEDVLSHDAMTTIINDAKKGRLTLKEATEDYLEHSEGDYGIKQIDQLFPNYKELNTPPKFIDRDQSWVSVVMNGVKHVPFSRIKTSFADITADEARARGYTKGKKKIEEVFTLLKRTTDPQTVYKKQKFDRDDVIDITDFDVVAWVKGEMRGKLDEELARSFLIGDGRQPDSDDKIQETHIRPIWTDDAMYSVKREITKGTTEAETASNLIDDTIRARKEYKGSGNPTLFTSEDVLAEMLLLKDKNGIRIYKSVDELATAMRVSKIVTVPQFDGNLTRENTASNKKDTFTLKAIMVNLVDYTVGADKGGAVSMFDDFDIDYNQMKYLIETRCSGALTVPKSAIVFETKETSTIGS
jgi:HK97 family phage prohead protease